MKSAGDTTDGRDGAVIAIAGTPVAQRPAHRHDGHGTQSSSLQPASPPSSLQSSVHDARISASVIPLAWAKAMVRTRMRRSDTNLYVTRLRGGGASYRNALIWIRLLTAMTAEIVAVAVNDHVWLCAGVAGRGTVSVSAMERDLTRRSSRRTPGLAIDVIATAATVTMLAVTWDMTRITPAPEVALAALVAPPPMPAVAIPAVDRELDQVRRAAHAVLMERCLPCHSRSAPGANPRALAIYDLDEPDWWRRLTPARFPGLLGRLRSASAAQRQAVTTFVDTERRIRGAE